MFGVFCSVWGFFAQDDKRKQTSKSFCVLASNKRAIKTTCMGIYI